MRYVKTTKIEHSLELNGDELQDLFRGELLASDGGVIDPPDPEVIDSLFLQLPPAVSRAPYPSAIKIDEHVNFILAWTEEDEEVEE